jgi:hypothetical protein
MLYVGKKETFGHILSVYLNMTFGGEFCFHFQVKKLISLWETLHKIFPYNRSVRENKYQHNYEW